MLIKFKSFFKSFASDVFEIKNIIRIFFAITASILISRIEIPSIEYFFYDLRVMTRPSPEPSGNIEIVLIDKDTTEKFNTVPDITLHKEVLQKIVSAEPRFIIYASDITKIPAQTDKKFFADYLSNLPNFYQAVNELERKNDESSRIILPAPFQDVKAASMPKTSDTKLFAKDGVTRRMFLTYQDIPTFHTIVAQNFNSEISKIENIRGQFDLYDAKQVMIDFMSPGSFSKSKFEEVFDGKIDLTKFKDKIVIIGDDLGISHEDYIYSPYLRNIDSTTIAEMHANILETLLRNSAPRKTPDWINLLFTVAISILTVHVVLNMKPLKGIIVLGATAFSYTFFSYFLFWLGHIWIDMAHPYLAIFLCYYFFIPYRLIIENQKSWEYQQKNKLLSEVETLKTNFIGMMSHDLKTPLARIQGMTEIITSDPTTLSHHQREALDTIKNSSEDLLKFISTILNYARIESQGLELNLQAKDVNQVIKEAIKKHEFHARLKQIQIIPELEPLFSIQMDSDLIRQVISNVLENAIKYSPEKSKILVTSEESDGKIIIQIADQGLGIPADELPNIFTKFFRSKNAKSSPIKGSGLGLYLAKYFIELHNGQITVESSPGEGSTFTVELPLKIK